MNAGEQLWRIPNGFTPDNVKNNPALEGVDLPNTGQTGAHATTERVEARDRCSTRSIMKTGEYIGTVDLPAPTNTAPMTYLHEGRQYIIVSVASPDVTAAHVALALPD